MQGRAIALGLGVAVVLGAAGWAWATHWAPARATYPVQGIDVSAAQGTIDWPSVRAAGADFAYIEASSGDGPRDPRFAANWAGAHAAGLRRGAFHRFAPCRPAAGQARAFLTTVPRTADALPAAVAVIDDDACMIERTALVHALGDFIRRVETHTAEPVLLQLPRAIERRWTLSSAFVRPVWATGGFLRPDYAARPWRLWRANGIRRIDGVAGPVGWNVVAP